ncbi:protein polyglycylase TTLL10-like [Symsagittifera roscoffensis]|uniref:protein polyglycylase TTLL10-like n=1 Tax=Symsagittifera roscoffensis TaxID=84072 RepID=UPI00307BE550
MQQKALQRPNSSENNDLKLADFSNETFILNNKTENAAFRKAYKAGKTWICKPSGLNQGIGIFLVRSLDDLDANLKDCSSKKSPPKKETSNKYERIIQRYIDHPLLLDNKKIDIRAYMLIASTAPFVVFYHPGYLRTCIDDYKLDDNRSLFHSQENWKTADNSLIGHLNNQYIQKSHPSYEKKKDDTIWSYERANVYLNQHFLETKGIEEDWWYKVIEKQAKRIMLRCFNAVKSRLKTRIGTFELLGFDFMIDEKMKVYLIEVNVQLSLTTNCQVLDQVIPPMVYESIDVVMEIWEKTRRGVPINPIQSRRNMEVLYNETTQSKVWTRSQQSAN